MSQRHAGPRTPPHNLEAEESILGAAMLTRPALEVLATTLRPEDFYKPAHGHICAVLTQAFEESWDPDPVTIAAELARAGQLDAVGGKHALIQIQAACPAATAAARYAQIVHDHATLRRLLATSAEITEHVYSTSGSAHDAVLFAQELLGQTASNNGARAYSTLEVPDVGALLDGDLTNEEADFLTRVDGRALLYAGKMHVLQGEPTAGKSWLALQAVVEVLGIGGAALYLDYEDSSRGILGRLLALGADPAAVRARFVYVQPAGAFGLSEKLELERILARLNPDLVVIDGVAEALARDGRSEDKASEVVGWIEKLPRWMARTGAGVVMLDHVVKDREQQGRWARGSGAKLAAVDGATYVVRVVTPFSRHRAGTLKLIVAKDRPGGVGAINDVAAVAQVEPKGDGERVLIRLEVHVADQAVTDTWKPTVLMRKVSEELERSAVTLTARDLKNLMGSNKPGLVGAALARLQQEGYVMTISEGRRNVLKLVKAYTPDSSPPPPAEPPPTLPLDRYEADKELFET